MMRNQISEKYSLYLNSESKMKKFYEWVKLLGKVCNTTRSQIKAFLTFNFKIQ